MCKLDIAVRILQQIGTHAVQNSRLAERHRRRVFPGLDSLSGCLHADQLYPLLLNKIRKHADGVRSASHTCHHDIRKLALRRKDLFFRLAADDALKLLHHLRVRIRSHSRTDDVKGILRRFCPGADRLVGRIL